MPFCNEFCRIASARRLRYDFPSGVIGVAAIALLCVLSSIASAQHEAQYLSYRPESSPASREKPVESLTTVAVASCEILYNDGSFTVNQFEADAIRKEKISGKQGLDEYDAKWAVSAENRKTACMQLLKETGKLRWRDRLLLWWQGD